MLISWKISNTVFNLLPPPYSL